MTIQQILQQKIDEYMNQYSRTDDHNNEVKKLAGSSLDSRYQSYPSLIAALDNSSVKEEITAKNRGEAIAFLETKLTEFQSILNRAGAESLQDQTKRKEYNQISAKYLYPIQDLKSFIEQQKLKLEHTPPIEDPITSLIQKHNRDVNNNELLDALKTGIKNKQYNTNDVLSILQKK